MEKMKILTLNVAKVYFDVIRSGKKTEEEFAFVMDTQKGKTLKRGYISSGTDARSKRSPIPISGPTRWKFSPSSWRQHENIMDKQQIQEKLSSLSGNDVD